jgi:menaquinone-dependent protoporphyrinogen oxidase
MSILVAYASKHGATEQIAERIAENLREAGKDAEARPVQEATDLDGYEGFVVGSAAYVGHWMKDAAAFVMKNQDLLAQRPVWLFSSGPLGTESSDAAGAGLPEPEELPELQGAIHPRGHRVFSGVLDPDLLSVTERSFRSLPAVRATLPEGDFRDWDEIQDWAYEIALELTHPENTHQVTPDTTNETG